MRWWIVLALVLAGCATEPEQQAPEVVPEPMAYQDLFSYDLVESFTYEARSLLGDVRTTTEVEDRGTAYRLANTVTYGELTGFATMDIDKQTHACLSFSVEEDDVLVEEACPPEGLNSASSANALVTDHGEVAVRVPAGLFDTREYFVDGVTYFVTDIVPVPVKYSGEGYELFLVTYE